jgi:membrane peptidoglycan carboxypeptidase
VLGTSEVTLLEMTRAYGVLAAAGWRADLHSLIGVRAAAGAIVLDVEPSGVNAVDPAVAAVLTSALRGVIDHGTGGGVRKRFRGHLARERAALDPGGLTIFQALEKQLGLKVEGHLPGSGDCHR